MISQKCNLRCTYCYGTDGSYGNEMQMNQAIAFKAIDWLINHSGKEKNLRFVFFGGEPLLNFSLMEKTAAYARKRALECQKTAGFEITTNATLITEKIISFFKEYNIIPCVSFDGPAEIQDAQRPLSSGKGSFNQIVPRIRLLLSSIPETACRATWIKGSDPELILTCLRELGFKKIMLIPASLAPDLTCDAYSDSITDEYLPFIQTFAKETDDLLRYIKDRDIVGVRLVATDTVLWNLTERVVRKLKKETPCGAGRELVAVSANGDLFPCHRFTGYPDFKLGNIASDYLDTRFNPWQVVDDIPTCSECPIRYHCSGGCYHDNLASTGDHNKPSTGSCDRKKAMMGIIEKLSLQLTESDIEFLYQEKFFKRTPCPLDFR